LDTMKSGKILNNMEIAELLRDVAAAYKLQHLPAGKADEAKNRFKIIAYERAADAIEHLSSEVHDIWDEGKLEEVGGIGPSIAQHLDELFRTGKSKHFDSLMKDLPPSVFELMKLPGIGPKTAYKLATEFKISNKEPLKQLEKIAKEGKIASLEGFGEQSQAEILKVLSEYKGPATRYLLPYAETIARDIIAWVTMKSFVKRADPLGSLRRRSATIGDIDIAAASFDAKGTIEQFCRYPHASRVLEQGDRSAAILLPGNVHVDLLVHDPDAYGATLQHFTGSKHHNVALREFSLKKGLSLSDYGITKNGKLHKIATEEEFYKELGMDWIPPELREDMGEIKAALYHTLPKLVELSDIKADLQIHSNYNIETSHDLGLSSMNELVKAADKLGYEYIAFTEHNPSKSKHSSKQIVDILKKKQEVVEKLNYSFTKNKNKCMKKVFNSLEIDILPNGELPVPEEGLATLDFALVSIHSAFTLPKKEMTARILRALSYPKVKIFAHPTGRKLNAREGADIDWPQIFAECKNKNIWIEINCDPSRLDLPDILVKEAVKEGVKLTLGTDAHHIDGLLNMPYGISVARRGWATRSDIINTRTLKEFEKLLKL
jgi:DNA polymerase (family 10)